MVCWQVDQLPIFCIATSREQQYSLGYTFTGLFLEQLHSALLEGGDSTLLQVYERSEEQYWQVQKHPTAAEQTSYLRFYHLLLSFVAPSASLASYCVNRRHKV